MVVPAANRVSSGNPEPALAHGEQRAPAVRGAVARSTESTHRARADGEELLARAALELYHQLNFVRDIDASSQAVEQNLRPVDDGGLDDTFAKVTSELVELAEDITRVCEETHVAGGRSQEFLRASTVSLERADATLSTLNNDCNQVTEVAKLVEGFARQTSLLALNARIEAARAGSHGLGFAVVADEVSKLAARIKEESDAIRRVVARVTGNMRTMAEQIQEQVQNNSRQNEALEEMVRANDALSAQGARLPETVERLDQFLDPLSRARQARGQNQLVRVVAGNLCRNLESISRALRRCLSGSPAASHVQSLEEFVEKLTNSLTQGDEVPVERWLSGLQKMGVNVTDCVEAIGLAVQGANVRQKQRHVSVGEYYLNFLVVERALKHLEKDLGTVPRQAMPVVLGNARGDFHSLGREMVGLFLRASGMEVIDVGLGAEPEQFVQAAKQSGARVVGVSSLLVESAKEIRKIRTALDRAGLRTTKIVAGGACFVVDREFGMEVGADFVATAASDMVSLVQQIYQHKPLA